MTVSAYSSVTNGLTKERTVRRIWIICKLHEVSSPNLHPQFPPNLKINSFCCLPQVLLTIWETNKETNESTDYAGQSHSTVYCRLRGTAGAEWQADGNSQSFYCSDCKALQNSNRSTSKKTVTPMGYTDTMLTKNPYLSGMANCITLRQDIVWGWTLIERANQISTCFAKKWAL